jgi:hypothetical protein
MTAPRALADYKQNPFTLVYDGAITENEPGKVNVHPVKYRLGSLDIVASVYTPARRGRQTMSSKTQMCWKAAGAVLVLGCNAVSGGAAMAQDSARQPPIIIEKQGSFAVGGTVVKMPGTYDNNKPTAAGQSFHGDHLYAFYQVPQNPKVLPIVMLHGAFQSARSWETTPDGREGFQTLFLCRGYPVYLVDQPRRGRAGNSTVAAALEPTPLDQLFFDQFRIGAWPAYFEGVQFDRKPETL